MKWNQDLTTQLSDLIARYHLSRSTSYLHTDPVSHTYIYDKVGGFAFNDLSLSRQLQATC